MQNAAVVVGLVFVASVFADQRRAPYWTLRRAIRLFDEPTEGADLSRYRADGAKTYGATDDSKALDDQPAAHGSGLLPYERARRETPVLRRRDHAALEWLIDEPLAPRRFWGHALGHRRDALPAVLPREP